MAAAREGVQKLGLKPFGDPKYASNVVTAFLPPEGVDPKAVSEYMLEQHNVLITGGQGELRGRILRIGHLGTINKEQVERTLYALEDAIGSL